MLEALKKAEEAFSLDEVPVGAVIVAPDGTVLAARHNETKRRYDPCGHAEILAIREAALKIGNERLVDCDVYVTLEPCAMCAGAISHARIRRVYYGAEDRKGGACDNGVRLPYQQACLHKFEVYGGISAQPAQNLLVRFFQNKR